MVVVLMRRKSYGKAFAHPRMMEQVLLNVAGVRAELAVGKFFEFAQRGGILVHGAKNSGNPNIHGNGIESFEGKKQHTVRHLSSNPRQQAEALTRFGGRFICQRA